MSDPAHSATPAAPQSPPARASARSLDRAQWRQLLLITLAAICIYVGLRWLPTGTNLNHMDFRVQGNNSIDFCDPLNPQFISVVAARSPVTLALTTSSPPRAGHSVNGMLSMRTAAGKTITMKDLLVVHERPLHLMLVDPSLTDYQHVHPEPGAEPGSWTFSFEPRFAGHYRLFADFTPVATARGLYANVDLEVTGDVMAPKAPVDATSSAAADFQPVSQGGYTFALKPSVSPVRADKPVDYTFHITASDGGDVPMRPVMGAFAHLVAFDAGRTGFAHLHPAQADPLAAPDRHEPTLGFKLTIPKPGRYVIWAQVNLAGEERFVPFWFSVAE